MNINQVVRLHDGFYAMVEGKLFGPWEFKGYAQAGLATELRRFATRKTKDAPAESGKEKRKCHLTR